MNAMTKVAPPLTAERLIAVVKVLPPAASVADPTRALLYRAIRACEEECGGEANLAFEWAYTQFGDPFGLVEDSEEGEEARWIAWSEDAYGVQVPPSFWNHLLAEAERLAPDFSRWSLPGARFSLVGEAISAPAARLQVWSDDDDEDTPELAWAVPGLIPAHSLACFVGEPGQGKTSLALSLAVRLAAGLPFAGREVLHGVVVYVAAEGHPAGLKARIAAMRGQYGVGRDAARIIRVNGAGLSLCRPADVDSLIRTINAEAGGRPVRAVFLDTLSQMMPGQDENGATAMGQAVASVSRVRDAFSTAVVVIHHPAKGGRDPRGHGCFKGALDALFFVSARHKGGGIESVTMENTKQRDARLAPDCVFDAIPNPDVFVPLYRDAEPVKPAPAASKPKLSDKAKLALAFLSKNGPATETEWRAGIARQITSSANTASQRTAFARVRDELLAAGAVELDDGGLWRAVV